MGASKESIRILPPAGRGLAVNLQSNVLKEYMNYLIPSSFSHFYSIAEVCRCLTTVNEV